MNKLLIALALALLALPVSIVTTLLLIPFWRWLEAATGIESIGHSGPADWCFVSLYLVALLAGFGGWFWLRSRPQGPKR